MNHLLFLFITGASLTLLNSSSSLGQFSQQSRVSGFSGNFRSSSSAILSRPTVSPYLALTDLTGKRFGYDVDSWRIWWRTRERGR